MHPIIRLCGLYVACLALSACVGMQRPTLVPAQPCNPDPASGSLAPETADGCAKSYAEVASQSNFHYTMYFAEFDDQGWPFATGDRNVQIYAILDALRRKLAGERGVRPHHGCVDQESATVHLLIFVHGWKHTAESNDGNVKNFRRLTRDLAEAECTGGASNREVIGLYIGWRGKSWDLGEPLNNVSFWDRKSAAADVAQGSVRELFAAIDAIVDTANSRATRSQRKPVRMMMVGHSFGGHILLTALGGSVIKSLSTFSEKPLDPANCPQNGSGDVARDSDLIVLVNPAIEGTRYDPIHRVAERWRHRCYRAPLMISVTSEADVATKVFFRLGRLASTLFEDYESAAQRYSDRSTFGHNEAYLTHELRIGGEPGAADATPVERCTSWQGLTLVPRIKAEYWNHCHFARDAIAGWNPRKPRAFCGGAVLKPLGGEWRAPILNIRASKSLIQDHSEIYDERFVSFLREIYMDTLIQNFEHPLLIGGQCSDPAATGPRAGS